MGSRKKLVESEFFKSTWTALTTISIIFKTDFQQPQRRTRTIIRVLPLPRSDLFCADSPMLFPVTSVTFNKAVSHCLAPSTCKQPFPRFALNINSTPGLVKSRWLSYFVSLKTLLHERKRIASSLSRPQPLDVQRMIRSLTIPPWPSHTPGLALVGYSIHQETSTQRIDGIRTLTRFAFRGWHTRDEDEN